MNRRPALLLISLTLSFLACTAAGPTDASNGFLTVQANATGLLLTNRSATDSLFARTSYKFLGVQSWMEAPVCVASDLRLGPQEQRIVPYAEVRNYGNPTDQHWAVVEWARGCEGSLRLTVRVPSR